MKTKTVRKIMLEIEEKEFAKWLCWRMKELWSENPGYGRSLVPAALQIMVKKGMREDRKRFQKKGK